jgi:hypothetical protein
MKALKLIHSIEKLVELADKKFYYQQNNLQLRFSTEDTIFVIGTREDGMVYLSAYYGFEIDFKFYMEKDGNLLMEEGSTPGLLEYIGTKQVLRIIDNSGDVLLEFGAEAIEWGNYEFKTLDQVRDEFDSVRKFNGKKESGMH